MAVLTALTRCAVLLALIAVAHGTAVNRGGCTEDMCAKVDNFKPSARGPRYFGYYFGIYNQRLDVAKMQDPNGPVINYQAYRVSLRALP